MSLEQARALIAAHTERSVLGVLGQDRVNVTELNVALETADAATGRQ
jgi:K+-transporting ATPase c subunit